MTPELVEAQRRVNELHAEEAREKKIALKYPDCPERDDQCMRGERLSDETWHLEETLDIKPADSGLRD